MRKFLKTIALLMALAMLAGVALTEGVLETPDTGLDIEETEDLEIGEGPDTDVVDEMPEGIELTLGELDLQAHVTYRFFVDDAEVATQVAGVGEEIRRPEAPEARKGKAFAGWTLANGTPLFVDADGDGQVDPVIAQDYELGTEVCVWAVFTEERQTEAQPAEEEQPTEEEEVVPQAGATTGDGTEGETTSSVSPDGEPASPEGEALDAPAEEESIEEQPAEEEQPTEEEEVVPQAGETTGDGTEGESTSSVSPDGEPASPEGEALDAPAEEESIEEQLAEEQLAEEQPAEEEQPAGEEPAGEESIEEQPVEEEPTEEAFVEEVPIEESAEEESVEEQPTEEEPTGEGPIEEQPVAEGAAEDQPAAVPLANELVYTGEAQALVSGEGWLYSLDGETYTADIPAAVDAGEYTVYYKTAEDAEAQTLTVTVAKVDVVLIPPEAMNGEA